jgi:hypothetical protein
MKDQSFIETIVKAMVSQPDEVRVERKIDERGVLLTLFIAPADMPVIIGKQGRTIDALRTLLRIVGSQNEDAAEQRVNLQLFDPEQDI